MGIATCLYDERYEPRQIDFAPARSELPLSADNATARETSAATPDHFQQF